MRIRSIQIRQWRHFEDISLQLEDDAGLVCIVGANGTGKSHLLELIAACAHRLGLAQGIEIPRGDPFADAHDFSLQFYLAEGASDAVDGGMVNDTVFALWDRTLTIESQRTSEDIKTIITAGGIPDEARCRQFAERVVDKLRSSQSVHFLSLDADRAYPKKNINFNEIAQAYEIDWEGVEYTRGRSYKTTTTLYDEWLKYFLAQENQSGTRLMQEMRRAKKQGTEAPEFEDHFEAYAASLQKVLPHVLFTGVDSKKRTLLFDTTGLELAFDQLSGGEREIAFLIGQIDRFGLRQGLFLLDEPELHLNSDLIRTWVAYLISTVQTGQIWLATHSLEAVEAAGQHATFILERNEQSRKVDHLARLDTRPVLSALSRAVGTPAFSISQLVFVFIEGEEGIGERERFHNLAGLPQNVRFLECGSCTEVVRRVATIKSLAQDGDVGIRIGGVVDRDFRTGPDTGSLRSQNDVFVLNVHEIENLFLHPITLERLIQQNGKDGLLPVDLIRDASDVRAGSWIFQTTLAMPNAKSLPEIPSAAKSAAKQLTWTDFCTRRDQSIEEVISRSGFDDTDRRHLGTLLSCSISQYERKRQLNDLWLYCEGKQVLQIVAHKIGFNGAPSMIQAAYGIWNRGDVEISEPLKGLREYLSRL